MFRAEAIPGRVFYDFDGKTVKDPIKTLADAGLNAFRVETMNGQCLGPTIFHNGPDTLSEELLFTLDFGCIDIAVKTAQQAVSLGMKKFQLTINMGTTIPTSWESYNYTQMFAAVQQETKRQLQPFLDVKLVPDIILFENEGSDGFLITENSTGHDRTSNDGKASSSTIEKELCGQVPTGNMASYPQLAGFYKGEAQACSEAIQAAGFSTASVRYGLHSHGQFVQWKESAVHGPTALSQTALTTSAGTVCDFTSIIPSSILAQNASEILTIMGFSAYPDPITPVDINSPSSQAATLQRLNATLIQLQGYAEAYGKQTDGPFAGQSKLQSLGVEYGTTFTYDQIPQQQAHTQMMLGLVKRFSSFLGLLWYEPWYCYGDFQGGNMALCHRLQSMNETGEAPTDTLTTWGKAAVSPWKK